MFKKTRLIIDTDPGIDDAVALALAFFEKKLKVDLIVTTPGNIRVEDVTKNALNLVNYFGKKIPVVQGAMQPLEVESHFAYDVHGESGLGGFKFKKHLLQPLTKTAPEAMYEVLKKNGIKGTTILALAPATNIALLFLNYPNCKQYIKEIVMMTGTIEGIGNAGNFYDQFNIYNDPHAADIVINSGLPIVIVPTEMGHTAYFSKKDVVKMSLMNDVGQMFEFMFRTYKDGHVPNGTATHDQCAVAYLVKPKMFKTTPVYTRISLDPKKRGEFVFTIGVSESPVTLCLKIDIPKFKKWFFKVLRKMKVGPEY